MTAPLRVATHGSALARWQAEHVAARLGGPVELVIVTTTGDRDRTSAIHAIGGNGVFVKEVQEAVRRGDADLAVHSAKDLPAVTPADLVIAAVPSRADARDALVGATLRDLPLSGTVGTGSVRRRAQLAAVRPDLRFAELRGNVPTRVERARDFDAVVIAYAALARLDLTAHTTEVLPIDVMLPMVGQGALAVECRAGDTATIERVTAVDDTATHRVLDAERAFLAELGGGCTMPCGAFAEVSVDGTVALQGLLAALDGSKLLRTARSGADGPAVGRAVAREILDDLGGAELLESIEQPG